VPWLRVERLFGEWRIPKDTPAGRVEFKLAMEARRWEEDGEAKRRIERGWCYGSAEFRAELLTQMEGGFGPHHGGVERRESAEAKAGRLLAEELKRRKWDRAELTRRRKGDRQKLELALRLRRETTMTWAWLAQQLALGTAGHAANGIRRLTEKS
jgi:hypothetical protein